MRIQRSGWQVQVTFNPFQVNEPEPDLETRSHIDQIVEQIKQASVYATPTAKQLTNAIEACTNKQKLSLINESLFYATFFAFDPSVEVRTEALINAPVELINTFKHDPSSQVREQVASLTTNTDVLNTLAIDNIQDVQIAAIQNVHVNESTLRTYAEQSDDHAILVLALHHCPSEILRDFARHSNHSLREKVAAHPKTESRLLVLLSSDKHLNVRAAAAHNTSTPTHILSTLATSPQPNIREAVAQNSSTSPTALERLCKDTSLPVRSAATTNPNTPSDAVLKSLQSQRTSLKTALAVAQNPHTNPTVLTFLSEHTNTSIRTAVARNVSTPTETLERLVFEDSDPIIKMAAAHNPSLPAHVRAILSLDPNQRKKL